MTRKEQIEEASIGYQISTRPMAIGGDVFAEEIRRMNLNPSFIKGAEWADENPNPELKKQWMDKAIEWLDKEFFFNKKEMPFTYNGYIHRFKKYMEDK